MMPTRNAAWVLYFLLLGTAFVGSMAFVATTESDLAFALLGLTFLLLVVSTIIWIIVRIASSFSRPYGYENRISRNLTPRSQQRLASSSQSGARVFCEYCGAPVTPLAVSCGACGRVPSPIGKPDTVDEFEDFAEGRGRTPLSPKLRYEILHRDGYTCRYCGRKPPEVQLEVDHIEPVSQGGTDDPGNLITSCRDCNRGKGILSPLGGTTLAHPTVVVQREVREREIVKVKCRYCGSLNHDGAQKCNSCEANL